jgi:hypothetical protein
MALIRLARDDLSGRSEFEALFGARLRLLLGHFASFPHGTDEKLHRWSLVLPELLGWSVRNRHGSPVEPGGSFEGAVYGRTRGKLQRRCRTAASGPPAGIF